MQPLTKSTRRNLVALFCLVLSFSTIKAQTNYYTRQAGAWNDATTVWSKVSQMGASCGCNPGASLAGSNAAYIYNNITATTFTSEAGAAKLVVESGDSATISTSTFGVSNSATITVNAGGVLIFNANVNASGATIITNNGTVIINGNFTGSGSATVTNNGTMYIYGNVTNSGSASFSGMGTTYATGTVSGPGTSGISTLTWKNNGTSLYYNSGNVGIGTSTPIAPLEVKGQITADSIMPPPSDSVIIVGGNRFGNPHYPSHIPCGSACAITTSTSQPVYQIQNVFVPTDIYCTVGNTTLNPSATFNVYGPGPVGRCYLPPNLLISATSSAIGADVFWVDNAGDVNSGPLGNPKTAFELGGNKVLWHNGNSSNIYVGVNAGNNNPVANTNTFVGNMAGQNNATDENTFLGNQCGTANTVGTENTFIGRLTGNANTVGIDNTFTGWQAGVKNTTGDYNTFGGWDAGASNTTGDYNTFHGYRCGNSTTTGFSNSFYGKKCGYSNIDGFENSEYGAHAGFYDFHGDSNAFFGDYSAFNEAGSENVMMGYNAGGSGGVLANNPYKSFMNVFLGSRSAPTNTGNYNIVIGAEADAVNNISNATTIGASSFAENSNQFILGNNDQMVGIGLSKDPVGPIANLEISTDQNPAIQALYPPPYIAPTYPLANGFIGVANSLQTYLTPNPYNGTGFSGLKFRDLTSNSLICTSNPGPGVLALDQYGNVIYVPAGGGNGIGICGTPTLLTNDADISLSGHNFYFDGNGAGKNVDNVIIGHQCVTLPAKLEVWQQSGSNNSIGIYVENDDLASGNFASPTPLIGIKSLIPPHAPNFINDYNIAGWFQAPYVPNSPEQYGIFIPHHGGIISVGYPLGTMTNSNYIMLIGGDEYVSGNSILGNLTVNNTATINGNLYANGTNYSSNPLWTTSDSMFKTNVDTIGNALAIVSKLKPKTYYFDSANIYKMNLESTKQYGFIAQDVQNVLPSIVHTIVKPTEYDSAGNVTAPSVTFKALDYTQFTAILTSAVQQQQESIDSLRNKPSISGGGTTNYVPVFTAPGTLGNSLIYNYDGGVAINDSYVAPNHLGASNLTINQGFVGHALTVVDSASKTFQYDINPIGIFEYNAGAKSAEWSGTEESFTKYGLDVGSGNIGNGYRLNLTTYGSGVTGTLGMALFSGATNNLFGNWLDYSMGMYSTAQVKTIAFNSDVNQNSYFNTGGNVGIGTSTPVATLDVRNNAFGQVKYGIFTASTGTGGANYGIYASAANASVNNYAGYFNGDVTVTGTFSNPSDSIIKTHVDSISNCNSILSGLKTHTFNYDTANYPALHLPGGTHYGMIAQEVARVLPTLVHTTVQPAVLDSIGDTLQHSVTYKTLNYLEFIPLLVKGYQCQQRKIDSLQSVAQTVDSLRNMMNSLKSCIDRLCSDHAQKGGSNNGNSNTAGSEDNVTNITLSNSALLYQNIPNPFSTGTKINYYIPEGTMGAMIVFFDMYGSKMKEVILDKTGAGTINVTPDNLTNGMYSYSLIINGQVIDTKKMVLSR